MGLKHKGTVRVDVFEKEPNPIGGWLVLLALLGLAYAGCS